MNMQLFIYPSNSRWSWVLSSLGLLWVVLPWNSCTCLLVNIWMNFCWADTWKWNFWISWTTHMFSFRRHCHTAFQFTLPPAVCGVRPVPTDLPLSHSPSPGPHLILGPQVPLVQLLSALSKRLPFPGASVQDFSPIPLLAPSSPGPGDTVSSYSGWHHLDLAQPNFLSHSGAFVGGRASHASWPTSWGPDPWVRPSAEHWGSLINQVWVLLLQGSQKSVWDTARTFLAMTQRWIDRSERKKWRQKTSHGQNSELGIWFSGGVGVWEWCHRTETLKAVGSGLKFQFVHLHLCDWKP